jgi:RNA recognition motif. (a.k.a. RRM, RBD, or RNP domain)
MFILLIRVSHCLFQLGMEGMVNGVVGASPMMVSSEGVALNGGGGGGGGSQGGSSGRSTPSGGSSSEPAPGKLFVGGLSWQTSAEKLREYFGQFGKVTDVLVMKDPVTQVITRATPPPTPLLPT